MELKQVSATEFFNSMAGDQVKKNTGAKITIMSGFENGGKSQESGVNTCIEICKTLELDLDITVMVLYCYGKTKHLASEERLKKGKFIDDKYAIPYGEFLMKMKSAYEVKEKTVKFNETMFVRAFCMTRFAYCASVFNGFKKKLVGTKALAFFLPKENILKLLDDQIDQISSAMVTGTYDQSNVTYIKGMSLYNFTQSPNPKSITLSVAEKEQFKKIMTKLGGVLTVDLKDCKRVSEYVRALQLPWKKAWEPYSSTSQRDEIIN